MNYEKRYQKLNNAQKLAVDNIDGPIIIVAGPGTGKTELLSMRTANILQKTDTLPENILCLTFTDSGANAMRERLTQIIGKEAYKVAIHTFHSFGSEIINRFGKFFYNEAHFKSADELNVFEIINQILKELNYDNPLANTLDDNYIYLNDIKKSISDLKKSGLVSEELINILNENDIVMDKVEKILSPIFNLGISKNTAIEAIKHIEEIRNIKSNITTSLITPLSIVLADSLQEASSNAIENNSTKPITAWRNDWFKKDENRNFVLKSRDRQVKLRALCPIYDKYLNRMREACLYDFDDMILRVVHAIEMFSELRFNLQEQYQYIMVDEFQDTNLAQMRILHNLTDNDIVGDMPNILVVGDDDQAIYSFQGADISNIIDFRSHYPKAKLITLTENYRSTDNILKSSRNIITQGNERLENYVKELNKELISQKGNIPKSVNLFEAESIANERHWLVADIKSRIKAGGKASEIAVFTRRHSEIEMLLPYFFKAGIKVNYEHRNNILDESLIIIIEEISRLIIYIANGQHNEANSILPKILSHDAWGLKPIDLWNLSITADNKRKKWLEIMQTDSVFKPIFDWLIKVSAEVKDKPLEEILDIIIGKNSENPEDFTSPIYNYYFSNEKISESPQEYLNYLEALRTIRNRFREYRTNQTPTLYSFIDFIDMNRKANIKISNTIQVIESENAVNIMTAHKSKGLEFDTVYIFNAVDSVWGEKSRKKPQRISYPENLPFAQAGENDDDKLRLFYVAMTRAKKHLNISYSQKNDKDKNTLKAIFLANEAWEPQQINIPDDFSIIIEASEIAWYQPIIKSQSQNMHDLLLPKLKNYKLSVTHLQNFVDVVRGGPQHFFIQSFLKFPERKSVNSAFGTAIHDTLQQAHNFLISTGKKQAIEDIVAIFEQNLIEQRLNQQDFDKYLRKGADCLNLFLNKNYDSFSINQLTELNFNNQNSIINETLITGKLDLVDIDKINKKITVTDYKTGKPSTNWKGRDDKEKIKLYKYRQQLLFYKLLIENSRDYQNYKVEQGFIQFIEPNNSGTILSPLEIDFQQEELEYFSKLVNAVWSHIIELDFPDTSHYDKSIKGILNFEQALIDKYDL